MIDSIDFMVTINKNGVEFEQTKVNVAKTNAQKQADRRNRLSHDGLFKRRDFWAHPDDEPELRKLESELRQKRINEPCL